MDDFIQVHVQLYGAVQVMAGWVKQAMRIPRSSTVEDLFQILYQADPSLKSLLLGEEQALSALVMVNSMDIKRKEGVRTVLAEGDRIDVVAMISGG
ncbi:MoaD/ThiS family protein [Ammoniphilus sp. 3BR4]|uniref:MoaD/ThiS family protein n=1 Tax=Ammoniphilus sp. 3BR4 TaxID=3158265 RepID=UPI0034653073